MLLWILNCLSHAGADWPSLHKTTFRASLAAMVSFALALAWGPRVIAWLQARFREPVKSDSEVIRQLHRSKQWTPTMGGLFIVAGLVAGLLVFGDLTNPYAYLALLVTLGLAALGAVDDLVKLRGQGNGLSVRAKLVGQIAVAGLVAVLLYRHHARVPHGLELSAPLLGVQWRLGLWFIPLAALVIVASSNAVNLADGLDGLAGGCLIFACGALGVVAYASGHAEWAAYLGLPRLPGSHEILVLVASMIGGLLGFLWFNCHPAQVFMGDTGSLPLGGLLGLIAVATRQEALLLVVGGVFVVEAGSVILQVGVYKWKRRRVFLCAPLHHHFQFQGVPENKIVVRFWIASALCAILGLAMMKINATSPPMRGAAGVNGRTTRFSALPRPAPRSISSPPQRPES